ncbi:hypothetical protein [Microvirga calopogonii]|uniref:hypothetical protein n=1 Tax=Microvirga calopogonii TaxID=2078013 RepID=UPI0013B37EFF|nr:hypothetical protein [Microvirga calopogonii]
MKVLRTFLSLLGIGTGADPAAKAVNIHASPRVLQTEPDHPVSFGCKVNWFAIRTTDSASVREVLGLDDPRPANWASGVAAAYEYSRREAEAATVFVSPAVRGWILVISVDLPYPADASLDYSEQELGRAFRHIFSNLASHFEEVQFFGTYRVVGFDAWARARHGRVERIFSFRDGEVLANEGPQSLEEAQLGFLDLGARTPEEATSFIYEADTSQNERSAESARSPIPDEQDTIDLAGLWSLDPTQLNKIEDAAGVGFVASLPHDRSRSEATEAQPFSASGVATGCE